MLKNKFNMKQIVIVIAMMGSTLPISAETWDNQDDAMLLPTINVKDKRMTKDQIGENQQFSREIVNVYKGKEEVETYKGSTVSDLLSGLPGVYSGDSRNSGALDPNIRGQQGQGRIPVTIDGTEQSITIWRGYAGANNRNYVDPNLISSVYVEKGPSLDRNVRSGIGGSVALKTLDVDDFIAKDKKFGMEIKLEGGNNSIKPRGSVYDPYIGKDYRNMPNPLVGSGGMWRMMFDDSDRMAQRFDGRNKMFTDKAGRIAIGTRQDHFDAMLAYSYRDKGNYFSGKKGAEDYGYVGILDEEKLKELEKKTQAALRRPRGAPIGLFFHPGGEVTNTSLNTRSWLGKLTFRLPENQSIKLGWRHTNTRFGEIMPSRIFGPVTADTKDELNRVPEWSQASVKQQAYNIDYAWKPKNNRWIDLQASLWATRTKSATNSAGGAPGDVLWTDSNFDQKWRNYLDLLAAWDKMSQAERDLWTSYGMNPTKPTKADWVTDNIDGRHNAIAGEKYYAKNNRIGFNLSNKMKLHDKLELTLMGDFQYEKLKSNNNFSDFFASDRNRYWAWRDDPNVYRNLSLDNIGLPRNGKRNEYNLGFNFKFEPTERLTLTAGARYTNYTLKDDGLENFIARNDGKAEKNIGITYKFKRTATPEQYQKWKQFHDQFMDASEKYFNGTIDQAERDYLQDINNFPDLKEAYELGDKNVWRHDNLPTIEETITWEKDGNGRLHIQDNPLLNGSINLQEQVPNPKYDPADPNSPKMVSKYQDFDTSDTAILAKRAMTADEISQARKQKNHGWAPMFSITYRLSDYARVYARYVETLRFPSIFEGVTGFSAAPRLGYKWQPEHGKNWEVGYAHDLRGFFPKMPVADVKINYFHNKTKNIMDRDEDMVIEQFAKHVRTGVELQGRFDTGRVFGKLGVVRNIKNKMCDAAYAASQSHVANALTDYALGKTDSLVLPPTCANGGLNPFGYLSEAIPPRWSVDAELGARWLQNKLETGVRMHYHSRVYNTNYNNVGAWDWNPVTVWDAYARYKINDNFAAEIVGTNLTDRYYLDPFSRSYMPAPGRTIRLGVTATF